MMPWPEKSLRRYSVWATVWDVSFNRIPCSFCKAVTLPILLWKSFMRDLLLRALVWTALVKLSGRFVAFEQT